MFPNELGNTLGSALISRLCLTYEAKAGGYLTSKNLKTNEETTKSYTKVTSNRTLCYRYDNVSPQHCSENESCNVEPLSLSGRIIRSSLVVFSFEGWLDPYPDGFEKSYSSSVDSYTVSINEIIPPTGQVDAKVLYTTTVNNTVSRLDFDIDSSKPVLYRIMLTVRDAADNVRYARRFLLYDNSSKITSANTYSTFVVTSASRETNYMWQVNRREICLNWTGHFYNDFYKNNQLLNAVESEFDISGVYEQLNGPLPVQGTRNVDGIVRFTVEWSVNTLTNSTPVEVRDFQTQTFCNQYLLNDGDTITFTVRPIDIVGNVYSESRTVYIDRSSPLIQNVWLTTNGFPSLYIRKLEDIKTMEVGLEAMDPHSGVRSIHWTFGVKETGEELYSGSVAVKTKVS